MGTDQAVGATVYAHSYGGVIAAELARADFGEPITLHTIASPLAGHPLLTERCQFDPRPERPLGANVTLRQWRTIHELDGAFKDLAVDPQVVDIPGSEVVVLPRTYRKRRLGHNWSVVWVAEETAER